MSEDEGALAERVAALERTVTDGETPTGETSAGGDGALAERVAALESDLAHLEAAVRALRGYVGEVRRTDREIERTAEAALAAATDETEGPLRAPTGDPLPDAPAGPTDRDARADAAPEDSGGRTGGAEPSDPPTGLLARLRDS